MDKAITQIASYLVSAAWQVPILLAAGWLLARLLRRMGAATQHNVWELTLLLCVLVPALPAPEARGHIIRVDIAGAQAQSTSSQTDGPVQPRAPIWLPRPALIALSILCLAAALWSATRLLLNYGRTRRIVRRAMPCALPPEHEAALQQCLSTFGLRDVRVLASTEIFSPATVSFNGHALLLPQGLTDSITPQDFAAAAAHECAHMRRHDFRKHLLYSAIALPISFHPLTRMVRKHLATTREMACDSMAAGAVPAYPAALLRLAAWVASTAQPRESLAMGIFDTNTLEERMNRLMSTASAVPAPVRYATLFAAMLCLCATATAAAVGAVALAPADSTSPQKVYNIGKGVSVPKLIHQVDPEMPHDPASQGTFDGTCTVGLVVDTEGVPQNVHIIKSLGEAYDANAMAAVQQYRFRPAIRSGKPVPVNLNIMVNYRRF